MSTHTYTVEGMSCAHCAGAVSAQLRRLPGVDRVAVDVTTGTVEVVAAELDPEQVRLAVAEAGYTLAG